MDRRTFLGLTSAVGLRLVAEVLSANDQASDARVVELITENVHVERGLDGVVEQSTEEDSNGC